MNLAPLITFREVIAAFTAGRGHRWAELRAVCDDCDGPLVWNEYRRESWCAAECWTVAEDCGVCGYGMDEHGHADCRREEPDPCDCGCCDACERANAWRWR